MYGNKASYGEKSILYRRKKGWSRLELARHIGVYPSMVRKIEAEKLAVNWIPDRYKQCVCRVKIYEHDWLFLIRRRLGLTQTEFAHVLGCAYVTYNNAENARYMRHLAYVLARVQDYLKAHRDGVPYNKPTKRGAKKHDPERQPDPRAADQLPADDQPVLDVSGATHARS